MGILYMMACYMSVRTCIYIVHYAFCIIMEMKWWELSCVYVGLCPFEPQDSYQYKNQYSIRCQLDCYD